MNRLEIIGHIGNDAEIKDLGSNQVINFSVAVSETYLNKTTNEKVENSVTRMVTEANSVTTNVSKKQDVTSTKINNEFELVISDDNFDAFVDSEEHADLTSLQVYGDLNSTLISLNGIENLKNLKKLWLSSYSIIKVLTILVRGESNTWSRATSLNLYS